MTDSRCKFLAWVLSKSAHAFLARSARSARGDLSMKVPEQYRVRTGRMASDERFGNNGAFMVPLKTNHQTVAVIASEGQGWCHVSVSRCDRTPSWDEMCEIKEMFFGPDEWVVQYHPAAAEYCNAHPFCLHLWRSLDAPMPTPPIWMVGPK